MWQLMIVCTTNLSGTGRIRIRCFLTPVIFQQQSSTIYKTKTAKKIFRLGARHSALSRHQRRYHKYWVGARMAMRLITGHSSRTCSSGCMRILSVFFWMQWTGTWQDNFLAGHHRMQGWLPQSAHGFSLPSTFHPRYATAGPSCAMFGCSHCL